MILSVFCVGTFNFSRKEYVGHYVTQSSVKTNDSLVFRYKIITMELTRNMVRYFIFQFQ